MEKVEQKTSEPVTAPGVRPSKRERDKIAAGMPGVKREASVENERDIASKLVEPAAGDKPPEKTFKDSDDDGDDVDSGGDGGGGGDPGGDDPGTLGLKELAKKLEMTPKELYSVTVPMGAGIDGETKTIGDLKDFYQRNFANKERLENVDREEMQLRTERGRALTELDQLVSLLPKGAVSKEYIEAVSQQARVMASHEVQKLVKVNPAFADPVTFQAARAAMGEVAGAYGLTTADVDNIIDHRWILALHDLAQLRAARDKAKGLVPDHQRASGPTPSGTQQRAASAQTRKDQKAKAKADPVNAALGILVNSKRG